MYLRDWDTEKSRENERERERAVFSMCTLYIVYTPLEFHFNFSNDRFMVSINNISVCLSAFQFNYFFAFQILLLFASLFVLFSLCMNALRHLHSLGIFSSSYFLTASSSFSSSSRFIVCAGLVLTLNDSLVQALKMHTQCQPKTEREKRKKICRHKMRSKGISTHKIYNNSSKYYLWMENVLIRLVGGILKLILLRWQNAIESLSLARSFAAFVVAAAVVVVCDWPLVLRLTVRLTTQNAIYIFIRRYAYLIDFLCTLCFCMNIILCCRGRWCVCLFFLCIKWMIYSSSDELTDSDRFSISNRFFHSFFVFRYVYFFCVLHFDWTILICTMCSFFDGDFVPLCLFFFLLHFYKFAACAKFANANAFKIRCDHLVNWWVFCSQFSINFRACFFLSRTTQRLIILLNKLIELLHIVFKTRGIYLFLR